MGMVFTGLRFMPDTVGEWRFVTKASAPELDGQSGRFVAVAARAGVHGPIRVADKFHFRHADGARYLPFGTTAYAWTHQGREMEEQTLATLKSAPFNKIRMCVFPKHYRYNEVEPEVYPFKLLTRGDSAWGGASPIDSWAFDFDRFEPAFFQHLEKRIADLAAIGVQADLILLHPYDRWGFSTMTPKQDDAYLRYVVARLAAYANVWWSMANEFDFMATKSTSDWDRMIDVVATSDPHGHLLSIHNGFAFYDYTNPHVTHASVQRGDTMRGVHFRLLYGKPVTIDECGYEGDVAEWWGNLSAIEMVHRVWTGVVNGAYVTHGDAFTHPEDKIWWGKGGAMKGESPPRIAFLRRLLEQGPDEGLNPMPHSGTYRLAAAGGIDNVTLPQLLAAEPGEGDWPRVASMYAVTGVPHRYYLTYFGQNQPAEYAAVVPPNERYSATSIDVWAMTETVIATDVVRGQKLKITPKSYMALLLQRLDA